MSAVAEAARSGWLAPVGPDIDAFEAELAGFVGIAHGVALNSGTSALHLGLLAAGVKPGDLVITSSMTFVATANAATYAGANPVFVDTLSDGTIDPSLVEKAIQDAHTAGQRVGAVIPVDIYGRMADYSAILPVADKFEVPVVCDSAEALGASRDSEAAGSLGVCSAISFNGNKIMTTSAGGMLFTHDSGVADHVRYLASQARERTVHYEHLHLGFNYRMSNLCAALGRAQLSRLPEMIARRRALRTLYIDFFSEISGVDILPGDISEDNCWLTAILIDREAAGWGPTDLYAYLETQNIESRPLWKPMHLQPLYRRNHFVGESVAEDLFESGLVLPSGSNMSTDDIERVLETISQFIRSLR